MDRFIKAIEAALVTENWYAALTLSLTLPDICSGIDDKSAKSSIRYPRWFDEWVGDKYISEVDPNHKRQVFLSGKDCYALRCSYLHNGEDDITNQRARKVIDSFHFCKPYENNLVHNNRVDNVLQLQVDVFCNDITNGVRAWEKKQGNNYPDDLALLLEIWPNPLDPNN